MIFFHQIDLERRVTVEEAEAWCKENGDLPYIETSAKDATNVEASFMMCLRRWANNEGRQVGEIYTVHPGVILSSCSHLCETKK